MSQKLAGCERLGPGKKKSRRKIRRCIVSRKYSKAEWDYPRETLENKRERGG